LSSKLPFLHSQIVEYLYSQINSGSHVTIEDVSDVTGYPSNSKILLNAILALKTKGYIEGDVEEFDFSVPDERSGFYQKIIGRFEDEEKFEPRRDYLREIKYVSQSTLTEYASDSRVDLVSDLNRKGVVHNWYDYLEDFPYELVQDKLDEFEVPEGSTVLDPYCGSGTTLVTSKMLGMDTIGIDANPLMCQVTEVKTNWQIDLDEFRKAITNLIKHLTEGLRHLDSVGIGNDFLERMPKRELNQWMSPRLQREVAYCKDLVDSNASPEIRRLLQVIMGKSAFDASYVSLCPGTTFYPYRKKEEFYDIFCTKLGHVYSDLVILSEHDSFGGSKTINVDCRRSTEEVDSGSVDFMITSPPYPNDLEYTRQTRLELYLLDFVKDMNDIRSLKKEMIKGSTKLIYKGDNSEKHIAHFDSIMDVSDRIAKALEDKNWGFDYPKMVKEYFGDMYLSLVEFHEILKENAPCLLVVGDQTYKEVVIPVAKILCGIGKEIGYRTQSIQPHRIRRSTTHSIPLPEEIVILRK
jgi:hypothetical protein